MIISKKTSPYFFSLLLFFILSWGSITYTSFKEANKKKDIRSQTLENLVAKKSNLERSLYSRIFYTRGIAAIVALNPDITNNDYYKIANEFIKNDSIISSMALSKNCVITAISPLEGHEEAIGLNLLDHPERRDIVERTIQSRQTFVAGPVELIEGGIAFISYTPIFNSKIEAPNNFWGVTDIVIYRDSLLSEAGLKKDESNFKYALRGNDGTGAEGNIFWGDASTFSSDPVIVSIDLPTGYWELAASPKIGWSAYYEDQNILRTVLLVSSLIISILLLLLTKVILKIKYERKELKAIFKSLNSLIIEFDEKGFYRKLVLTNNNSFNISEANLIGKNVSDIMDEEVANQIKTAISECLSSKEVIVIDYLVPINSQPIWFRARLSVKSESRVILTAYDITDIKLAEEELKTSEAQLKDINQLKNRLFSILAHDLKNPISSFKAIAELLLDEDNVPSEASARKLLTSVRDTSEGLTGIIDNLLIWSKSQQNLIKVNPKKQSIDAICNIVIASQQTHAMIKQIKIDNRIDPQLEAYCDTEITKVILRNLISNAIKYSFSESTIIISAKIKDDKVVVSVIDKGCGLPLNSTDQLFTWNDEMIRNGTNNEKGSGLGLVLCKEFSQIQGGSISAQNNYETGSTFELTLPLNNK